MTDVALGVTVFQRTQRLAELLESITGDVVDIVYVADNGTTSDRTHLYESEFPFELTVLDLEYDAGLGRGREAMVEALTEEYLIVVDSDNRLPSNVDVLIQQLQAVPELGGVGGVLLEEERLLSRAHDFYERSDLLFKDTREPPKRELVAGYPLFRFDKIQNIAAFKRACVEEYCWDPNYTIGWEHSDFFYGHLRQTDWEFGICPAVHFEHNPGGANAYVQMRTDPSRLGDSKEYFLKKWNLRQVIRGQVDWIDTTRDFRNNKRSLEDILKNIYIRLPTQVLANVTDARDARRYK